VDFDMGCSVVDEPSEGLRGPISILKDDRVERARWG
jgi:hypothetical protein